MREEFIHLISYNHFVELMQSTLLLLIVFLKTQRLGGCTGTSFIDTTPLRACHIKRVHSHLVMQGLATKNQCSIGWFFGLKLHFIINDKGEILDLVLTPSIVNDRKPISGTNQFTRIQGKLFGDKGYISKTLFELLFIDGIHPITILRKNMKNSLMHMSDKILNHKRSVIETVVDQSKIICQIEYTRNRSTEGFIVNLISGLIAYSYLPKKPILNLEVVNQLMALAI